MFVARPELPTLPIAIYRLLGNLALELWTGDRIECHSAGRVRY